MSQVLSQDEVDALLKGVSDGDVETEQEEIEEVAGVILYDLTSRDKIISDRMPALDVVYESFSRLLRSSLSAFLRKAVDVRLVRSEMMKFEAFLGSVPLPSHLNMIRMDPLPGLSILAVEAKLVFSFVDCYFGGSGGYVKVEGRDFSAIEQKVMKTFVTAMLSDLKEAWDPVQPLDIILVRSEINPQFVGVVGPSDIVLVVEFEVELEKSAGEMSLCIPYSTLEPIRAKLIPDIQKVEFETDQSWAHPLSEHLREVEAEMWAELGSTNITIRDILDLHVGDVIEVNKDVDEDLFLKVEGVPKFMGYPGLVKGNRALKIRSVIPARGDKRTDGRK